MDTLMNSLKLGNVIVYIDPSVTWVWPSGTKNINVFCSHSGHRILAHESAYRMPSFDVVPRCVSSAITTADIIAETIVN